jgi:hypothetical protein
MVYIIDTLNSGFNPMSLNNGSGNMGVEPYFFI